MRLARRDWKIGGREMKRSRIRLRFMHERRTEVQAGLRLQLRVPGPKCWAIVTEIISSRYGAKLAVR